MQALQITAFLAGSIALSRPEDLVLDGIIANQLLRLHFGEDFFYLPDPKEVLFFANLPLEMRGNPSDRVQQLQTGDMWMEPAAGLTDTSMWYWACSSAQIDIKGHDTQYWNKRFDTQAALSDHIDFGGKVEKILIEQGRYKAYHMPLSTIVCEKVVWYVYGDAFLLSSLLLPVSAIGKKRVQGNGAVLRWEIVEIDEDASEWKNHRLMRPLPGPLANHIEWSVPPNIQYIAYRAPQWHSSNQCLCVTGGKRDE